MQMDSGRTAKLLLLFYGVVFIVCAISPYDRAVWWAENIPTVLVVVAIILISRKFPFTNTSYSLMAVFIILHTIGGHYSFERVPFNFFTDFFGFERNHYDRLAHFSVGFYAFAIAEVLLVKQLVKSRWLIFLFPVFTIVTVAGVYEIIEWQYAIHADASAGIAVLGSQGDIWDAQKDILADTLGAFVVMFLFFIRNHEQLKVLRQHY